MSKPTIATRCPAAQADAPTRQTAELFWPSVPSACGGQRGQGALLQLSSTVLPSGRQLALLDVYRADATVLVRCAAQHLQAPAQPLGTTLQAHSQQHAQLVQAALRALALLYSSTVECAAERGDLTDHGVPDYSALQALRTQLQGALEVEHV